MKQVIIAGRTGKAAELRRLRDGTPVLSFSVATDDGVGDRKRTLWFDCSIFGKRAESLKDMLPKGKEVTVCGDLSTREHDGRTYLTIRVSELTLQGARQDNEPRQNQSQPAQPRQTYSEARGGGRPELDDDVPFAPEFR